MFPPQPSPESIRTRNKSNTRRNREKVEQYLTEVEKVHGCARSWELRGRLERGDVTLGQLDRH
ncbi:MAG TPA: hypothetical protein VFB66_14580 [Tepidisphaeraceae bacterium]|nr:hypothetical protein [Tepidisphaeraceae bacterium]